MTRLVGVSDSLGWILDFELADPDLLDSGLGVDRRVREGTDVHLLTQGIKGVDRPVIKQFGQ